MQCPKCDHKMECNQTKNFMDPDRGYYYVERRRVCVNCSHRMYTAEISRELLVELTEASNEGA
jgi:transcriptional regulator NrdR family protein